MIETFISAAEHDVCIPVCRRMLPSHASADTQFVMQFVSCVLHIQYVAVYRVQACTACVACLTRLLKLSATYAVKHAALLGALVPCLYAPT